MDFFFTEVYDIKFSSLNLKKINNGKQDADLLKNFMKVMQELTETLTVRQVAKKSQTKGILFII